jgi:hypothetical protein
VGGGVKTGGEEEGEIRRHENRIRRRDDDTDCVSGGIIIPFAVSYAWIYAELSHVHVRLNSTIEGWNCVRRGLKEKESVLWGY